MLADFAAQYVRLYALWVPVAALPAGDCCDFVSQYSVWLLGGLIIGPIIKNRHYNTL